MGFSITWCAVREGDAQKFLEYFGLVPTGAMEEIPESPVSTAKLDTGWQIIWFNEYGSRYLRSEELKGISSESDLLLCLIEEHLMASSSEFWSGGMRKWWISHEGENGPKGLEFEGNPPKIFSAIKLDMEKAQLAEGGEKADVDYIFEIPLKVAQSLVGFKHDEDSPHMLENQFTVLSRPAEKRGLLGRLFGR